MRDETQSRVFCRTRADNPGARVRRPSRDRFYLSPHPAEPGTLLRSRRVSVPQLEELAAARQMLVTTVGATGQAVTATATVLTPRTRNDPATGPRPVVGWAPGAHGHGLCRDAAPSYLLATGREPETPHLAGALRRGWTVVVCDGVNDPRGGPRHFLAGRSGGAALLDAVRAARSVPGGEVSTASPVMLWGFDEGGLCVAHAAERARDHAGDLDWVGAAAVGVPADLATLARLHAQGPGAGMVLAAITGLAAAWNRVPLAAALTTPGWEASERAARSPLSVLFDGDQFPGPLSRWCSVEPWRDPLWRCVLELERPGRAAPAMPVRLWHGDKDALVPIRVVRRLRANWTHRGARVSLVELPGIGAANANAVAAPEAMNWFARLLAERAATQGGAA